jgi:hypothetical protein
LKHLGAWFLAGTAAIVLTAIGGCGGPTFVVQQYPGPPRPSDTIAIVRLNGMEPIGLDSLDGESIGAQAPEDGRIHIEVLPGRHRVVIRNLQNAEVAPSGASFLAQAGHVYRPVFGEYRAAVYDVDPNTDAKLADVTLVEGNEPMVEAPRPKLAPPPPPPPPAPTPSAQDAGVAPSMVDASAE